MEENKYYTPEPEELHIGYTCEACFSSYAGYMIFDLQNPENDKLHEPVDKEAAKNWIPFFLIEEESLFTANNTRNHATALMLLKDNRLRTKYLDREDVESLGWVNGDLYEYYVKENSEFIYKLTNSPGNHYIIIDAIIKLFDNSET